MFPHLKAGGWLVIDDIQIPSVEDLRARSKTFQYHAVLSKPDAEWKGPRGHVDREFVRNAVAEFEGRVFFLCGAPPFMDGARSILVELGVRPEQIRQETFGGAGAQPKHIAGQNGFAVGFSRSGSRHSFCLPARAVWNV